MAIRVADHIVNKIFDAGADSCFLVTGRGALFLNDALARHDEINIVPVHHEQTAGFAAVSYADKSGKPGFCMVSPGCAMTNALTAVLNAWQDGIPCILFPDKTNWKRLPTLPESKFELLVSKKLILSQWSNQSPNML